MNIEEIHQELQWADENFQSIDLNEFLSLFPDYENITILRKELIQKGYDVVEPILFFKELANEIPNLQETEFNNWDIITYQGGNFLIHTVFHSYDQYTQRIMFFNDDEDLEFFDEIKDPDALYNLNGSYLANLTTEYTTEFIAKVYSEVTYPNVYMLFENKIDQLCYHADFKGALDLIRTGSELLVVKDLNFLYTRVQRSFVNYSLFMRLKMTVLKHLWDDNFSAARTILEDNLLTLRKRHFNALKQIIEDKEAHYQEVIDLQDQAETEAAEAVINSIRRQNRLAEEEYQHEVRSMRLQEDLLRTQQQVVVRESQMRIVQMQEQAESQRQMAKLSAEELQRKQDLKIWQCSHCFAKVPSVNRPFGRCSVSYNHDFRNLN